MLLKSRLLIIVVWKSSLSLNFQRAVYDWLRQNQRRMKGEELKKKKTLSRNFGKKNNSKNGEVAVAEERCEIY